MYKFLSMAIEGVLQFGLGLSVDQILITHPHATCVPGTKQPATVATDHGDFTPSPSLLCLHLAFLHILWARVPVFWSSDANSRLTGKVPEAGKDRGQKEKSVSEEETAGRYYGCNGHELASTSGDGEGQGGLGCCSPWGRRVGRLNWVATTTITNAASFLLYETIFPLLPLLSLWQESALCWHQFCTLCCSIT